MLQDNEGLIGLAILLVVAVGLEFSGHLSAGMVSVLQWAGGAFMSALAASHLSNAMGPKQ